MLVLVPYLYDTAPGQRFGVEQWARYLERQGFRFTFVPFEDEILHQILYRQGLHRQKAQKILQACIRRLRLAASIRHYDVIFIHREASLIGPPLLERWIARQGIPIVYHFDDPIWLPYRSPTNRWLSRLKCPGKVPAICRLATAVIAGNRLLAGYARRYTDKVFVVPSTIDMERYPAKPSESAGRLTLGWTGSHSTLPFLKLLEGPLGRVAARYPVRLLVIADRDGPVLNGLSAPIVARAWKPATEAVDLHGMDVGLAPFPNEGWTPWRCHGKVLQYMATGIPTVASPVGIISTDYIEDGVNGFLAATEGEWVEKVTALLEDAGLRHRMGQAARKRVEDWYAAHVWAPRVGAILEEASRSSRCTPESALPSRPA